MTRVAKAAFATNKDERNELITLRRKMMDLNALLKRKGLSLAELEKECHRADADFNGGLSDPARFIVGRDEYGLPIFKQKEETGCDARKVFVESPKNDVVVGEGVSGVKDSHGQESVPLEVIESPVANKPHSWSQVLRSAPPTCKDLKFEYLPMPLGVDVLTPPDEVLREGNEKFRNCIVGTFSRMALSYTRVVEFAKATWEKGGLIHVSQKNSHVFIFKFASATQMNNALSRGTWYIDQKPMLVHAWGTNIHTDSVKNIPLWVKFENIPDCYWTTKGLSYLASTIAPPLGADALTSKLEILPFAKMCVNYKVGDVLPKKISVTDIDPTSGEKKIVDVQVSYPSKPLFCGGCKAIGHLIGACPVTKRQWVKKSRPSSDNGTPPSTPCSVPHPEPAIAAASTVPIDKGKEVTEVTEKGISDIIKDSTDSKEVGDDEGWHRVVKKRAPTQSPAFSGDESPSPLITFKNLTRVDEIDAKRGQAPKYPKSQRGKHRQRGAAGRLSPRFS
ncbi:hypothetical protein POM88_022619 [Heracleum sosnowskyi]|uniref:DUF4283 domain-containing protein n=1 Tax=Heracleum sosnowskyi TaxID=360622 RepID=A0AAD8IH32_9APIA|nr:hypothetical protein POM88_022619 [Heracleum sosnowskyi]